ncbi:MAG: glutathione peroxidase [Metamycoplasmataceae bacterium]
MTIYDFKLENISKEVIDFSNYQNKVILIVNVASKCGFVGQYEGLEKLYENYKDKGLVILGFPCTQFKNQEFSTDEEVQKFCTLTYNVTFEMFSRIDVKGDKQSSLYKMLTNEKPWFFGKDVRWNFEKFLIDRNGKIIKRFSSMKAPKKIEKYIKKLL